MFKEKLLRCIIKYNNLYFLLYTAISYLCQDKIQKLLFIFDDFSPVEVVRFLFLSWEDQANFAWSIYLGIIIYQNGTFLPKTKMSLLNMCLYVFLLATLMQITHAIHSKYLRCRKFITLKVIAVITIWTWELASNLKWL